MRILFVQYRLQPPGGGNAVSSWMLEALKDIHEVSVLTWAPFDPGAIDRFYGTKLSGTLFHTVPLPALGRAMFSFDPDPHEFHQRCYLRRVCKKIAVDFDLVMSADNETDFGCPGIQYVHFPWAYELYRRMQYSDGLQSTWLHKRMRKIRNPWRLISDNSLDQMKTNLTLVNSNWTGNEVRRRYGIEASTLYPPVVDIEDTIPWERRENAFVCIGRISGEKRLEEVAEIIRQVRKAGFEVSLHFIGTAEMDKHGMQYRERVDRLVSKHQGWITLHENLSRQELNDFIVRHRYGIHANVEEHFGIAVAEMVQAGCITFVPNSGGPVEIVDADDRICYSNSGEAVAKILRVLGSPALQTEIRAKLKRKGGMFSAARFVREVRAKVRSFEKPARGAI